ncbi:MAG TPA: substrate-binding domain-containing protein [Steroidobacteraceae bacterium]|jgi:molybdate transport system substrate-binding protein|nr:substrate-binding domain-containing protein [Steroidobacteraceae bacterium]
MPLSALCKRALPTFGLLAYVAAGQAAAPQSVQIFAAGSLRGVVTGLAAEAGPALGVQLQPSFGGSGAMRERIEQGESPDLLLSADLGSPRKLEAQGRTVVPPIAFARNRMCIVSRRSAGITAANLIDRMLAASVRVKTSTPIADPSGDYAWSIFKKIEALRPGAEAILQRKAQASMNLVAKPETPTQSAAAALFATHAIDLSITYCSGSGALEQELPELTSLPVPPELDPHPVYGVAVLSMKPEALRLALFLLSEKGQAIIAKAGLVPLLDAPEPAQ